MILLRSLTWSRLATLLLVAYWITLATVTHVPTLPKGSMSFGDKNIHFFAYTVLAFLIGWAWTTRRPFFPAGMMLVFALGTLYGAIDELTQIPIPGRSAECYDWLADVAGTTTGIVLFWVGDTFRRFLVRTQT